MTDSANNNYSESVNASTNHPEKIWIELAVEVEAEAVEPVSELLGRYGFNEGVAIDEPYVQDGDGDNLELDLKRPFVIRTWVADTDFKPETIEAVREGLWYLGRMRSVGELKMSISRKRTGRTPGRSTFPGPSHRGSCRHPTNVAAIRASG